MKYIDKLRKDLDEWTTFTKFVVSDSTHHEDGRPMKRITWTSGFLDDRYGKCMDVEVDRVDENMPIMVEAAHAVMAKVTDHGRKRPKS